MDDHGLPGTETAILEHFLFNLYQYTLPLNQQAADFERDF
jgi:hypothetical protein